jgi:hypothetical protein
LSGKLSEPQGLTFDSRVSVLDISFHISYEIWFMKHVLVHCDPNKMFLTIFRSNINFQIKLNVQITIKRAGARRVESREIYNESNEKCSKSKCSFINFSKTLLLAGLYIIYLETKKMTWTKNKKTSFAFYTC